MVARVGTFVVFLFVAAAGAVAAQTVYSSSFLPPDILARMMERPADLPMSVTVAAPRDSVWEALSEAYQALKIPVSYSDPAAGQLGTVKAKLVRRLGKEALSNLLRCGEGMTGPNADSYVVYLSVAGFVIPQKDGQIAITTLLTAHAIDLPNGRSEVMYCTTTGRLESRVAAEVEKRLGVKK